MKKIISFVLCIVLCLGLISSVSGVQEDVEYYVSKNLSKDPSFLNSADSPLGNSIDVTVLVDKNTVSISFTYQDISYSGILTGETTFVDTDTTDGYIGIYGGCLLPLGSVNSDNAVYIDMTATFDDHDIFVVVSVRFLSENSMPDIALYGAQSSNLSDISNHYSANRATSSADSALISNAISSTENTLTTAALDTDVTYRGKASCTIGGYELFNISSFHQREMESGDTGRINAKLNTSTSSFLQYLRNVEGYNNEAKGIALDAYPQIVYLSIGGYHRDYNLINNGCVPVTGQTSATIPIPINPLKIGWQLFPLSLVFSEVILTESVYVNGCTAGNNIASWEIRSHNWESDSLDGDYTTSTGVAVSADMRYNGNITQSVTRTINITGKVRYIVYMQSTTSTLPVVITTPEIQRSTLMYLFPDDSG